MLADSGKTRAMHTALAAVSYFLIVFGVGFLLGPIRVIWLEPSLGKTVATLVEAPVLLTAITLAAAWVPPTFNLVGLMGNLVAMGIGALALVVLADILLGTAVRNLSWSDQIATLRTSAGQIYLLLLAVFAVAPLMVGSIKRDR